MSTMSALQLSRQLTLRNMRNPQSSLLARSLLASRPASTSSKPVPKGRLLEKPTRFNPPSHPARLPRRNRQPAFQVPLSAKEKEQQRKKQYPHMMPPEGTFFHWFLTNRTIHVWITMEEGVFGGWTARDGGVEKKGEEAEGLGALGDEMPVGREVQKEGEGLEAAAVDKEGAEQTYTDFEGKRRPIKKWLGIW
ncbi:unnamed protein product [Aureobasidium mustum]|uniref:Uncharacterized protein n=1 Tax=Aureobasidium mustum TaxID=2773714 RepID=A0A9N8K0U2_9PEZI|nr:unnamed protein product [Aureobasidium mustum]